MSYVNMRIIGNNTQADRLLHRYKAPALHNEYVEVGLENYCMPSTYKKWAEKLYKFQVRDDDTFVMGFPRSGTTWAQEMVWLIVNDLNFEGAKERALKRIPIFEINVWFPELPESLTTSVCSSDLLTYLNELRSPRCMKTHLAWSLLPENMTNGSKQPKIIYILRNPKDVCVSYYNFYKIFCGYQGSFEEFCILFLEGRVICAPFWESVLSFWKQRHRKNILFIRYKDMKEDLNSVVKQVSNFLGKPLNEIQIQLLVDHLNIKNMRNNPAVNYTDVVEHFAKPFNLMIADRNNFIGKGEHNGYLSIMSPELIRKFDQWTKKHLEGTDLIVE